MKLYYYCSSPSCKRENTIRVKSTNRYDLKNEIGEEIVERCKHCGKHTKRHINRLFAKPNFMIPGFAFVMAVVSTLLLWDLGFVSTLTATVPIGIWMYEDRKASAFNKVMIWTRFKKIFYFILQYVSLLQWTRKLYPTVSLEQLPL